MKILLNLEAYDWENAARSESGDTHLEAWSDISLEAASEISLEAAREMSREDWSENSRECIDISREIWWDISRDVLWDKSPFLGFTFEDLLDFVRSLAGRGSHTEP